MPTKQTGLVNLGHVKRYVQCNRGLTQRQDEFSLSLHRRAVIGGTTAELLAWCTARPSGVMRWNNSPIYRPSPCRLLFTMVEARAPLYAAWLRYCIIYLLRIFVFSVMFKGNNAHVFNNIFTHSLPSHGDTNNFLPP